MLFRRVRRSVVNDDELKIAECLAEDALYALCKEAIDIAYHHDDRYQWFIHLLGSSFLLSHMSLIAADSHIGPTLRHLP